MKKVWGMMAVAIAAMTVGVTKINAQAAEWAIGARMGSGLQIVGQKYLRNQNYVEARVGMGWNYGFTTSEISAIHAWRVQNMDWTYRGNWFLDLGIGAFFGGASNYFLCGVQTMGKIGYEFDDTPVTLALDWSPSFGPEIVSSPRYIYDGKVIVGRSESRFNAHGLANIGVSCVYRF